MHISTATIDNQINMYLGQLNLKQKKALLTVAKAFAENAEEIDYSEDFKAELDSFYEEYTSGAAQLVSEEEVNMGVQAIIKGQAKK